MAYEEQLTVLQLNLLVDNVWICKPVAGAHGQGISFIVGLDCSGCPILSAPSSKVSFKRRSLGDELGVVVQKYIEKPHLVPVTKLSDELELSDGGYQHAAPCTVAALSEPMKHVPLSLHKYSLRFWIDVLWSDTNPEAWFYDAGYVQVANLRCV